MAETPNHGYNVPDQGVQDWHEPLNQNFEAFEVDIELRDAESNRGNYTPTDGAKFLATDTGVVYTGDGTSWVPQFVLAGYDPSAGTATVAQTLVTTELDVETLTGQLTGGSSLSTIAGDNLSIDSTGQLNAAGGGGGIQNLSGGDGIDPSSITDGDTLSVAAGNALGADSDGNLVVSTDGIGTGELATPFAALTALFGDPVSTGGTLQSAGALTVATNGGDRALELGVPAADSDGSTAGGNVLAGSPNNSIDGAVGAVVAGGGSDTESNTVYDNYGTVGGGRDNEAGTDDDDATTAEFATVGGGKFNAAGGREATVGGGGRNDATARNATVGGGRSNTANSQRATVAGGLGNTASGQEATVGGGFDNTASTTNATVGGGTDNTAGGLGSAPAATVGGGENNGAEGPHATVGGGKNNTAGGQYTTVGGGLNNTAGKFTATVGGGQSNTASEDFGTVPGGGFGAAEETRTFVWNDGTGYHEIPNTNFDGLSSNTAVDGEPVTGSNTFSVSATGGVRFITGDESNPNVTYIPSDSAGWTTTSSRAVKTNIDPVEPREALAGVEELEVATWEYETEDEPGAGTTHIGPMAEDFHDAFDVGSSDEHINSINADGVALAAIQGLSAELDERIESQADRINELEAENDSLRDANEQLRERNAELEDRLAAVEDRLAAIENQSSPALADD